MSKPLQTSAPIPRADFRLLRPEAEAIAAIARAIGLAAARRVLARKAAK